jgi:hypothetical protein
MATCEIKWIDDQGNPTPDSNIAVGRVRRERHFEHINGRTVEFSATDWFPICTAHAHRLDEPGMEHWTFEPLPENDVNGAREAASTACDECVAAIPDSETSMVNRHHTDACSLHPDNEV